MTESKKKSIKNSTTSFGDDNDTISASIKIIETEDDDNLQLLNLRDQNKVIHEYNLKKPQPTIEALANKYKVSSKHIADVLKNQEVILKSSKFDDDDLQDVGDRSMLETEQLKFLDLVMYEYLQRALDRPININQSTFSNKAREVSDCMAILKFRVTTEWMSHFMRVYDLEVINREYLLKKIVINETKPMSLEPADMVRYVQQRKSLYIARQIHPETFKRSALEEDPDLIDDNSKEMSSYDEEEDEDQTEAEDKDPENDVDLIQLSLEIPPPNRLKEPVKTYERKKSEGKEIKRKSDDLNDRYMLRKKARNVSYKMNDEGLNETDTDEDEVDSPSQLSECNGTKTKSRRTNNTISTCELNKTEHKETIHDENVAVSYEVSDEDIENQVDLKSSLKIEVAPTQLSECNVVTDLQTRSEGLQDIDKKKSEENNFSENDLLAINQIKQASSPAPSDEEEFVTLYEIVDDKDKKANDISSESPTIKKEPKDIAQTIKIEPSEPMETNDNEELTSSPPLESLNIKTEAIDNSSVNKSKGQNISKEKENAIGGNVNSRKGHLTEDSLPDIDSVEEAMRYVKILENYVMLKENYRAIGLISQLENAIKNPAKE